MTAEDPVEFNLPGINQVQIRDNIGFSLPAVLRTIQRQDPDIVVVSPVRDYETAEMGVKLALDCLVLARMEETDAAFVVETLVRAQQQFRLLPFALSRALSLVVAQRLVRLICTSCKVDVTSDVPAETLIGVGFPPAAIGSFPVYAGKGCKACNGTGYRGRIGLYEVMEIGEGIRELIKHEPTAAQIRAKALEERMLTLRMSGLEKVRQGITTIEEVVRETAEA
jgi:type IV pilus assembly protein PilB